ncbi:MAG: hypothetical protein NTX36_10220 [Proteobacteria bacterium]|nr:hypothetical protein [Pseudomonadota bacterium]
MKLSERLEADIGAARWPGHYVVKEVQQLEAEVERLKNEVKYNNAMRSTQSF